MLRFSLKPHSALVQLHSIASMPIEYCHKYSDIHNTHEEREDDL